MVQGRPPVLAGYPGGRPSSSRAPSLHGDVRTAGPVQYRGGRPALIDDRPASGFSATGNGNLAVAADLRTTRPPAPATHRREIAPCSRESPSRLSGQDRTGFAAAPGGVRLELPATHHPALHGGGDRQCGSAAAPAPQRTRSRNLALRAQLVPKREKEFNDERSRQEPFREGRNHEAPRNVSANTTGNSSAPISTASAARSSRNCSPPMNARQLPRFIRMRSISAATSSWRVTDSAKASIVTSAIRFPICSLIANGALRAACAHRQRMERAYG